MKLLQNFDTKLKSKLLLLSIDKYWKKNTFLVTKSRVYLCFVILLPILGYVFTSWVLVLFLEYWNLLERDISSLFLLLASCVPLFRNTIPNLINYYMDFIIIDPEKIVLYSQYGILKRKVKELKTSEVKFITTEVSWLLPSVLWYGNINILIESNYQYTKEIIDSSQIWRIHFECVDNTEKTKKEIFQIVEYAKFYNQIKQEKFTEFLSQSQKEINMQHYISDKLHSLIQLPTIAWC